MLSDFSTLYPNCMKTTQENKVDDSSKMIRTLCVLFFAILLTDYSTANFEFYSIIGMAAIISIGFFLIKVMPGLNPKTPN
jgi:hypothetical protein